MIVIETWPQLFKGRITLSVDKSLSDSKYAHSNHSYIWECTKTLDKFNVKYILDPE